MPVRVKICGITSLPDALAAVDAGADALGFALAPSPRRVTPEQAAAILRELPPFVTTVGLVVDQDPRPILETCRFDLIQFHGSEPPEALALAGCRALKAFRIREAADVELLAHYPTAAGFLLDAYVPGLAGGTGHRFPWSLAIGAHRYGRPVIVAGGLTPENVAECVTVARPYGVDVSSGVEAAPGRKDPVKVRDFVQAARSVCHLLRPEI